MFISLSYQCNYYIFIFILFYFFILIGHLDLLQLLQEFLTLHDAENADPFYSCADEFVCSVVPESPSKCVEYSPGPSFSSPVNNTVLVKCNKFKLFFPSSHSEEGARLGPERVLDVFLLLG